MKPVLVGWCPTCEWVLNPYPGPGTPCEGENDEMDTYYYHHRLHKRLMWKCSHEYCWEGVGESYFLTKKGLADHEAEYAESEEQA